MKSTQSTLDIASSGTRWQSDLRIRKPNPVKKFLSALKKSLESNSRRLQKGQAFLPSHLKHGRFTKNIFPDIARDLSKRLNLTYQREVRNKFSPDLDMWLPYQCVDHVFGDPERPKYFFEVESLDRSQLYLFLPHGGRTDESKLWYYWATVCKSILGDRAMPRYFIWLLVLPDQPVGSYSNWDCEKPHKLFDRKLKPLIRENPFAFYDPLIKASARRFIQKKEWMINETRDWTKGCLADFQDQCELILITCTGRQLVMSRGRDFFDTAKEQRVPLFWK